MERPLVCVAAGTKSWVEGPVQSVVAGLALAEGTAATAYHMPQRWQPSHIPALHPVAVQGFGRKRPRYGRILLLD